MVGAILKLSYNKTGDSQIEGGICGTCFSLDSHTLITCSHVLSNQTFCPNIGFDRVQYWALMETGQAVGLSKKNIISIPDKDLSFLRTSQWIKGRKTKISATSVEIGIPCYNKGYVSQCMPSLDLEWANRGLKIIRHDAYNCTVSGNGYLTNKINLQLTSNDVNINGEVFEVSSGAVQGMSGGPLLNSKGECIGLMSFGLPADSIFKTHAYALARDELINLIGDFKRVV